VFFHLLLILYVANGLFFAELISKSLPSPLDCYIILAVMDMETSSDGPITENNAAIAQPAERLTGVLDIAVDLLEDLQKVVASGRPKALRVRFGNKTIAEVPVALTAVAALAAGVAAVVMTKLAVEVVTDED